MKIKRKITSVLINLVWVLLASGVTVLLVAAINIKNHKTCRQVKISIQGANSFLFLNNRDIMQLISGNGTDDPVGKPIAACNLQQLQTLLEKNVWVKGARLFFDNNFILHIAILEREPVARVFDLDGRSFFIDSSGYSIPLSRKGLVVQLPVFTGFPPAQSYDSQLVRHMSLISQYILQDPFWKAQITQIDVTPQKTFEMVPTVGHHLIEFGNGENYVGKFHRLTLFYKKVLKNYGLDRYSVISVKYGDQIIGTKRSAGSRIDSLQALKNIQQLIEESKKLVTDTMLSEPSLTKKEVKSIATDSMANRPDKNQPKTKSIDPVKTVKPRQQPAASKKQTGNSMPHATKPKANPTREKPKAVMPKLH